MYRWTMLIAAASIAAGSYVTTCTAQNTRETVSPPADLLPPVKLDADTLRSRFAASHLGLKPQSAANANGLALPFGLGYSHEAKGVLMPLDEKSEWGVGVGLNLNAPAVVELSPNSVLGLQPKRAPGLMLNKKF
jgi:hypothetical protein